jgi:PIF1-like helicase/Helix-turn-helix domain/HRDC domain
MTFTSNPQMELAQEYVRNTNTHIFLTGKAGTGKTTFLHKIRSEGGKRMVVVAPTGVAAINAGGMTIHSFFQLPFGLFLPDAPLNEQNQRKFNGDKIRIIKSIDMLVIDEISMVRADLLDSIDDVLRRFRDPNLPFGGVQLLMIGDLHQLPPVVKDDEWNLLRKHYSTPYFFGSLALQKAQAVTIELKHIYRQSDTTFVDLLNQVRDNKLDQGVLDLLNSRFIPNFQPPENEPYITLTALNATAAEINQEKLKLLTTQSHRFQADITGEFPQMSYPTEPDLELKVGAQVMFVKNDIGAEKRFFNGKIGRLKEIGKDFLKVSCPGDSEIIEVAQVTWENAKYSLNESTKEVKTDVIGTFTQYPLKLAWAITIHKSQGLTFERAIIDAQAAFAHGQVYVALSRCKSFEGIVLRTKLHFGSVKTDHVVKNYSDESEKNAPNEQRLAESKRGYQEQLVMQLFNFWSVTRNVDLNLKTFSENQNTLGAAAYQSIMVVAKAVRDELSNVGANFRAPLRVYFEQEQLPEENEELQTRLKKAAEYFLEKLNAVETELRAVIITTDNKAVRKTALEHLGRLKKEVFMKQSAFRSLQNGFSCAAYMKAISHGELDFMTTQAKTEAQTIKVAQNIPHPELYAQIRQWRDQTAEMMDVDAFQILTNKTLLELVEELPLDTPHMMAISGIGKGKLHAFGGEIVSLIEQYCTKYGLKGNLQNVVGRPEKAAKEPKPEKVNSKALSFEMFMAGKSLADIAKERLFSVSTIEGHLAHYVGTGELDIRKLITEERQDTISSYIRTHPNALFNEIKQGLPSDYGYSEIRMVQSWMKRGMEEEQ